MSAVVKNKLLLYANDSVILVVGKDKTVLKKVLPKELQSVGKWFIDNQLAPTFSPSR